MSEDAQDLQQRALAWSKTHDGGRLRVWWPAGSDPDDPTDNSRPILAIEWDNGGVGELGTFYDKSDTEAMQTICDVFNWALDQLAPSERSWYGTRTYVTEEEP